MTFGDIGLLVDIIGVIFLAFTGIDKSFWKSQKVASEYTVINGGGADADEQILKQTRKNKEKLENEMHINRSFQIIGLLILGFGFFLQLSFWGNTPL